MAPSRKNKKAVSVTYIPDRSKAVDMGKRFTLKKRRTTIRPITFDISIAENDSSTLVSQDSARDIPGSQPEFVMDDKSEPSVVDVPMANQNAGADSPSHHSKDQAEGNKRKNGDQATPGHHSSMGNVGHQSSIMNVGNQSVAALLAKAGLQSSINKSTQHESQTMKTRHKSATLEAGRQSPSVKAGSQSVGHQSSVHQTAEDQSSTVEAMSRSPTLGAGHRSRTAEAESQSVRHQTAELDSVPGNRESLRSPSNKSVVQTSRKFLAGAQQQPSRSNIAPEQARLQPGLGKENNMDSDLVVPSDRTKDTEDTDRAELPGQSSHHLRSGQPQTKVLSSMKSALKRTKRGVCNVTVDRVASSSRPTMQPLSDKPDTGLKVATSHALENGPLPKDGNVAATSRIPSGDNLSDIFRAPMPVKGSIYSRPMSTAHTPCDTPMRPPNISSMPVAASTSQSFDIVPVSGQASGVNLGPDGNNVTRTAQAKRRQILRPTADDDQPLQDIVITVKRSSSSSSDEDHTTSRPTVSNLSELTVLMSAMEDTVERFINESQPNSRIKRFLHDVTEDTFAELRRASQASHSINKVNKTLCKGQNALRTKRKKLLQLQQERNRLEVEVIAAKKEMSDTANRDKINDYLLKLSRLTSGAS